jgi:hypothetical protein
MEDQVEYTKTAPSAEGSVSGSFMENSNMQLLVDKI